MAHDRNVFNDRRRALIRALGTARPSHEWHPWPQEPGRYNYKTGCRLCQVQSPFQQDRASHLYVIKEEPDVWDDIS